MKRKISICTLFLFFALSGCSKTDCWETLDTIKESREKGELRLAMNQLASLSTCLEDSDQDKGMEYYYHLGWTHHELQNYSDAIAAYDEGLKYQPDYAFAYWRRGLANEGLTNNFLAEQDFKEAVRVGIETVPNFLNVLEEYPEIKTKLEPYANQ